MDTHKTRLMKSSAKLFKVKWKKENLVAKGTEDTTVKIYAEQCMVHYF